MSSARLTLVAALYINEGREQEFDQFETAAAQVMKRYGGGIDRRIKIALSAADDQPYEIHVVSFPDERSFQNYRSDPDLQALSDLRTKAIRETKLWFGSELPGFDSTT